MNLFTFENKSLFDKHYFSFFRDDLNIEHTYYSGELKLKSRNIKPFISSSVQNILDRIRPGSSLSIRNLFEEFYVIKFPIPWPIYLKLEDTQLFSDEKFLFSEVCLCPTKNNPVYLYSVYSSKIPFAERFPCPYEGPLSILKVLNTFYEIYESDLSDVECNPETIRDLYSVSNGIPIERVNFRELKRRDLCVNPVMEGLVISKKGVHISPFFADF